jgi:hypothetical protein
MNRIRRVALAVSVALCAFAAAPVQRPMLKTLMREKLTHVQKVLEGVVTSDWIGIATHTRELERITQDPMWAVLKYPEYSTYSAAFVRSIKDLQQAAADRDLDKAPQAYAALTLKCVECHRYLARARIAR